MTNLRAILFDMDGTLTVPYFDFEAIRRALGLPPKIRILDAIRALPPAESARAMAELVRFEDDAADHAEWNPGAREILDWTRDRGLRRGILTRNSRRSYERTSRKLGIAVDAAVAREDAPMKPRPEPAWLLCERLGVRPEECVLVGDYLYDIQCGKAAGTLTVLLTNGTPPKFEADPDLTIHRLEDLREWLADKILGPK